MGTPAESELTELLNLGMRGDSHARDRAFTLVYDELKRTASAQLGRKRDGEPGVTVLWKGFQHLVDIAAMYRIMRPAPDPPSRAFQNKDSG